jgi:hypothetical protein
MSEGAMSETLQRVAVKGQIKAGQLADLAVLSSRCPQMVRGGSGRWGVGS